MARMMKNKRYNIYACIIGIIGYIIYPVYNHGFINLLASVLILLSLSFSLYLYTKELRGLSISQSIEAKYHTLPLILGLLIMISNDLLR